jgi:hypothetical protein
VVNDDETFLSDWMVNASAKEVRQVLEKIHLLSQDSTPDAKE